MPGGSVNLTCVAIGSPMPFVKWRLGALELTPEDNIPIGKNVLMLSDIRESATYTCVAASDLGNIESDAEVRVKGRFIFIFNFLNLFECLFVNYLRRRLASGEGIVSLGIRHAVMLCVCPPH